MFNTVINFASALGKTLGGLYGSRVISTLGRKKVFVLFNVLAILVCLMTQVLNVWTIAVGKLLHGTFATVVHMSILKQINETVPVNILGRVGILISLLANFGLMLCMGFGHLLPAGDYDPSIENDTANETAKLINK